MSLLESVSLNLVSPMILAFVLGLLATLVKSDLKIPDEIYFALTLYLLLAIGIKGGAKLAESELSQFGFPLAVAVLLSAAIPLWCYPILRKLGGFGIADSAGIAAHYGSVSAVTFGAVLVYLEALKIPFENFSPAWLAVMEVPGIVTALLVAKIATKGEEPGGHRASLGEVLREIFSGKSFLLLVGGLGIGLLSGKQGFDQVAPFFEAPFRGVLTVFLLEVGMVTGRRLYDLKKAGPFLLGFGLLMPLVNGCLGIAAAKMSGLSMGGATVLATLTASASYIAAPAAVRMALPQANPAYYLTSALAITFPFNVTLGIPIYFSVARWWYGGNPL